MQPSKKSKRIKISAARRKFRITDARDRRIEINEGEAADLLEFLYEHFAALLVTARVESRA